MVVASRSPIVMPVIKVQRLSAPAVSLLLAFALSACATSRTDTGAVTPTGPTGPTAMVAAANPLAVEAGIKVTAGRPSAASDYVGFSDGIEAGEDADTGGRALVRA